MLNDTHQELNYILKKLDRVRMRNVVNKIMLGAVNGASPKLDPKLARKTKIITLAQAFTYIPSNDGAPTVLLGLRNVTDDKLSVQETKLLETCVEKELNKQYNEFIIVYVKTTGENVATLTKLKTSSNVLESIDDRLLEELLRQRDRERTEHVTLLIRKAKLLEEIYSFRREAVTLPRRKTDQFNCQVKKVDVRLNLLYFKILRSILKETNTSINAYDTVLKDMRTLRSCYAREIADMEVKIVKYKIVDSVQYDEILQEFVQFKTYIENKEFLLQSM